MTVQLFMFLFTIGSLVASMLTEALKKAYKDISANILALVDAIVVGIFGTVASYILMGIAFNAPNVICIFLMTACIWIGSMIGYDKVIQTISQLKG